MNCELRPEIYAWLRSGGLVVTASERAARFLTAAFHRARRAEGLSAWPTPNIQEWQSFVRTAWNQRGIDGRLVLNSLQEQSIWAGIVAASGQGAALLDGPRHRLASLAVDAHQLLCAYAPQFLNRRARGAWQRDAEEFSGWLAEFDDICRADNLLSAARLPLELIDLIEKEATTRAPILLAGFDRMTPIQRRLLTAWSTDLHEAGLAEPAPNVRFYEAADPATELAACARWCGRQIAANPGIRLLVVAQDVSQHRGELERAFLRFAHADNSLGDTGALFEFSLGVPLGKIALARRASLLLRWLTGSIEEHELDWLFSTGHVAANSEESRALTAFMRALRRKGWQRTSWSLADFIRQNPGAKLPAAWIVRVTQAQNRLLDSARRPQSPLAWAELTPRLLELAGWPGDRPLSSEEFQVLERWRRTVEDCASLGFDGRQMNWNEFLALLDRALGETLFAPESQDAPILIAGPAESAGLTADAIWFLGASEDAWPARGATQPLLPPEVQRATAMPHASPQIDWDFSAAITRRLLESAPEVHFSYAHQVDGVDVRPSRLVTQLAGEAREMPQEFLAEPHPEPILEEFKDASAIPFPPGAAAGGSSILTSQSQCAFKAFATGRLAAEDWEPAEAGLTSSERGLLLHAVMHSIWAGPPTGIRSHQELVAKADLKSFTEGHVRSALRETLPARARDGMPPRYVELEAKRLITLVTEWLRFEAARIPFTVEETEDKTIQTIAGLELKLRLDRVDRLVDGSLLVIDYKTGDVSPKLWDLPRPADVQLPLYARFALDGEMDDVGGLVFAKIRAGGCSEFAGRVKDARATLKSDLGVRSSLVKKPLKQEDLTAWRAEIERLALDFLAGRAVVDPRDYPKTCERCGLEAICRVKEAEASLEVEDETGNGEADDD